MNPTLATRARRAAASPPAGGAGAVIGTAIRGRWSLAFVDQGHPRVVDPHLYGVLTSGALAMCGCQVRGSRRRGKVPDWAIFHLDMIEGLEILDEPSRVRDDYNPHNRSFAKVYSQV